MVVDFVMGHDVLGWSGAVSGSGNKRVLRLAIWLTSGNQLPGAPHNQNRYPRSGLQRPPRPHPTPHRRGVDPRRGGHGGTPRGAAAAGRPPGRDGLVRHHLAPGVGWPGLNHRTAGPPDPRVHPGRARLPLAVLKDHRALLADPPPIFMSSPLRDQSDQGPHDGGQTTKTTDPQEHRSEPLAVHPSANRGCQHQADDGGTHDERDPSHLGTVDRPTDQ